jgi:hypothetical protein
VTISASAPAAVQALDTMLQACAAWVAAVADLGNEADHSYYGMADLKALAASSDLPIAIITELSHTRTPFAAGAQGLPGGELRITIHASLSIADLETLGRDIAEELTEQQTGLANLSAQTGLSSEPEKADRAAGLSIGAIDIDCTYGLSP